MFEGLLCPTRTKKMKADHGDDLFVAGGLQLKEHVVRIGMGDLARCACLQGILSRLATAIPQRRVWQSGPDRGALGC